MDFSCFCCLYQSLKWAVELRPVNSLFIPHPSESDQNTLGVGSCLLSEPRLARTRRPHPRLTCSARHQHPWDRRHAGRIRRQVLTVAFPLQGCGGHQQFLLLQGTKF